VENCFIWLVIYLDCTTMHGLANLKHILTSHTTNLIKLVSECYTFRYYRRSSGNKIHCL